MTKVTEPTKKQLAKNAAKAKKFEIFKVLVVELKEEQLRDFLATGAKDEDYERQNEIDTLKNCLTLDSLISELEWMDYENPYELLVDLFMNS